MTALNAGPGSVSIFSSAEKQHPPAKGSKPEPPKISHPLEFAPSSPEKRSSRAIFLTITVGLGVGVVTSLLIVIFSVTIRDWGYQLLPVKKHTVNRPEIGIEQFKKTLQRSVNQVNILRRRVKRLTPLDPYLIIDTSENLIFLKAGQKLIHQGICSTGSYTLLKTADEKEQWIFKTPRGMFRIQGKIQDPVWKMPDWAFIEEGKPVPAPYANERFEPGVLGDYALELGDGYLIHGTLYQRFLGLPVTHGCVRLGDKELEIIYRHLQVGSKVFIY